LPYHRSSPDATTTDETPSLTSRILVDRLPGFWSTEQQVVAALRQVFTVVDNVIRVSPAIVADFSIKGERVVAVLDRLKAGGLPQRLTVDNGPEFVSKALDAWAYRNGVQLEFSRPGKPTDNAFVESFNGHFRAECLDQHWFASLEEARQVIEAWRIAYNTERPHRALGLRTPAAMVKELKVTANIEVGHIPGLRSKRRRANASGGQIPSSGQTQGRLSEGVIILRVAGQCNSRN